MSARFPNTPKPRTSPSDATVDLDATQDVHEESTMDLQAEVVPDAPHPDMMATSRMEAMPPAARSLADSVQQRARPQPAAPVVPATAGTAATSPTDEAAAPDEASSTAPHRPPVEDVTQLRTDARAEGDHSSAAGTGQAPTDTAAPGADAAGATQPSIEATTADADTHQATAGTATSDTHADPDATPAATIATTSDAGADQATADAASSDPGTDATQASANAVAGEAHTDAGANTDAESSPTAHTTSDPSPTQDTPQPAPPAEPAPALAPGAVLMERYLLEQVIGCGGTAIVFRARDLQTHNKHAPNARLAIKTPRPELGDLERATLRLQHEFEHARQLHHPNVVEVLEFRREAGQPYMLMELIEGRLLSRVLRERAAPDAGFSERVLRQCAAALQHAHEQQVVHGDFKPGNVFITGEDTVRIVDFGAAATPASEASRIPAGTPTYASPEVMRGQTPQPCDDVFSFACVAYEMLAGQHPFQRLSSVQARDQKLVPPRAATLSKTQWLALVSALSWNREERPSDISVLVEQLFPKPVPEPVAVAAEAEPPPPAAAPAPPGAMPRPRSWGFFAFLACIVVITVLAWRHRSGGEAPPAPAAPAVIAQPAPVPASGDAPLPDTSAVLTDEATLAATDDEAAAFEDDIIAVEEEPVVTAPARPRPPAPLSAISFASQRITTTEGSLAAVFVVNRSAPLNGRVTVNWRAVSGTAIAGEDFIADAGGTIVFADNQAQRAIYVPLINDTTAEDDETFSVVLEAPTRARLGEIATAEAVIRDDD